MVTTLFVEGGEALEDIAGFVGHANAATSAGYVRRLGRRPEAVSNRAAGVLDRKGTAKAKKPKRVPNDSRANESNRESNRRGRPDSSGSRGEA